MNVTEEIRATLVSQPKPVCAELTPFEILEAENESGYIKVRFEPQPAFGNHFGNIQGGFAVSMIDVVISTAAFVKTGQWLPTVEIKTSFIAPSIAASSQNQNVTKHNP
jgi:acyl-coenzyme A thioesterase PaaI-like protein